MLEVMRCLDEELRQSPAPDVKAYKVMRVLLEGSMNALDKGNQEPQTFDRATLMEICDPKAKTVGRDPARWLSTTSLEAFLDARMNSIRRRAEQMGLNHLPVIASSESKGGAGNQRVYWLATRPMEAGEVASVTGQELRRIIYTRTETARLNRPYCCGCFFETACWRTGVGAVYCC